jgi:hypothetical protein
MRAKNKVRVGDVVKYVGSKEGGYSPEFVGAIGIVGEIADDDDLETWSPQVYIYWVSLPSYMSNSPRIGTLDGGWWAGNLEVLGCVEQT